MKEKEEIEKVLQDMRMMVQEAVAVSHDDLKTNISSGIQRALESAGHSFNSKDIRIDIQKKQVFNFIYDDTPGSVNFITEKTEHKSIQITAHTEKEARKEFDSKFKSRVKIIDVENFGEYGLDPRCYVQYSYKPALPEIHTIIKIDTV